MPCRSLRGLGLAIACLTAFHAPLARAADPGPPPLRIDPLVEQLLQSKAIVSAQLAPDGRHIAAVARIGADGYVLLVDTATHGARLLATPRPWLIERRGYQPMGVLLEPFVAEWMGPDRVVINFNVRRQERADHASYYGEAVTTDGRLVAKLGRGVVSIQRDDAGKPTGWVLVKSLDEGRWIDRMNVDTGETLPYDFDVPGAQDLGELVFDRHGDILAATTQDTAFWSDLTRVSTWYRPDVATPWRKVDERSINDDPLDPVIVGRPGHMVVLARNGGDRRALWDYDIERHSFVERLAADDHDDVERPMFQLGSSELVAFQTGGMKPRELWLDPEMTRLQSLVDQAIPDHVNLLRRTGQGNIQVWSYSDVDPGEASVLDPSTLKLRTIFTANPDVDPTRMQPMQVVHYASSDGTDISAYLTMPGHPAGPAPLVVLVHGGPIARDVWRWQEDVQMFAAHGYAVLQPQFRGSAGFGLHFQEAGYLQWGRKAQDDISAGVRDLVARKLVDPARVCIVGTSYGGYAALWGLVSTPELYKCGVDTSGVSDIENEVTHESAGALSGAVRQIWSKWYGDPKRMRDAWAEVSPLRHADRIQAPLLIVHGAEDEIVPMSHGEKMRDALLDRKKDVQWLPFEAEGHGVSQLVDRRIWYGAMLELFARTIGEGTPPLPPTAAAVQSARALADKNHQAVWMYGAKP